MAINGLSLVKLNQVWIVVTLFPINLEPKIVFLLVLDQGQEYNCNPSLLWFNRIHNIFYNCSRRNWFPSPFQIEWNMIVVTVFLSILNQIEFHLVQVQKENCHNIICIPFNLKGNGYQFIWMYLKLWKKVFETLSRLNGNFSWDEWKLFCWMNWNFLNEILLWDEWKFFLRRMNAGVLIG